MKISKSPRLFISFGLVIIFILTLGISTIKGQGFTTLTPIDPINAETTSGEKPYHSAFERGVKIIGSTSHYVTLDLDAGPIIEQDVARVSHVDSVSDLTRKGTDLEKIVLSRAIWKHLQRKVLVYNNRTVIFV